MEAVWRIEVEDFPAFVVVDDKGNDFFAETSTPTHHPDPGRSAAADGRPLRRPWAGRLSSGVTPRRVAAVGRQARPAGCPPAPASGPAAGAPPPARCRRPLRLSRSSSIVPVARVHQHRPGLPAAHAAVAADELLEGCDLVEVGVVERVQVDVRGVREAAPPGRSRPPRSARTWRPGTCPPPSRWPGSAPRPCRPRPGRTRGCAPPRTRRPGGRRARGSSRGSGRRGPRRRAARGRR